MPASVTSSTVLPLATASTSSGVRWRSLPSKYEITRPPTVTPRSDASRRNRRVSSAATTSADASSSANRGEASSARPIGVAARTSIVPSCQSPTIASVTETSRHERLWGWIGPLAVAALALGVRMWHLGRPRTLSFDETYYAKQAWSMLKDGYAQDYVEGADKKIAAGNLSDLFISGQPTQIVHPEAGKWVIALGEAAFGMDSFGWRISAAVVGALTVLVLARLVRRLTGSTVIGCLAGLLLALDGVHLVMSRLALLDGFLTFWIVSAVACLAADHDYMSSRLHRPHLFRPWQLLAGVCFGMACGTKWSGVYVLAVFGLALVVWEVVARRRYRRRSGRHRRLPRWSLITSTFATAVPAFVMLVGVAA